MAAALPLGGGGGGQPGAGARGRGRDVPASAPPHAPGPFPGFAVASRRSAAETPSRRERCGGGGEEAAGPEVKAALKPKGPAKPAQQRLDGELRPRRGPAGGRGTRPAYSL